MLKMQQGGYVGYDTLERDINIAKLPDFISKSGRLAHHLQDNEPVCYDSVSSLEARSFTGSDKDTSCDELLDMSSLKEVVKRNGVSSSKTTPKSPKHRSRHASHSFHNSYTIYEETSDLSGNETKSQEGSHHSDLGSMTSRGKLN